MNRIYQPLLTALLMASSLNGAAFAHEGHDDAPGSLKAIHGGMVKSLKDANIEVLANGTTLKLYPVSHEGKAIAPNTLKLTATTTLPKGKPVALPLAAKPDHWEATMDAQGAHRYTLTVTLQDEAHSHSADFTIEPQESE